MPMKPRVHNPLPVVLQQKLKQQQAVDRERHRKRYEAQPSRVADRAFYSSTRWRRFRDYLLTKVEFALCVRCKVEGRITPTSVIDHILDRKDRPDLAFSIENMQPLCASHHRSKTNEKKTPYAG